MSFNIFPDFCGKLEGDRHVRAYIGDFEYEFDELPLSGTSRPEVSPHQNGPSATVTTPSIRSVVDALPEAWSGWDAPIRQWIGLSNVDLLCTPVPPRNSSSSTSAPSLQPPWAGSSGRNSGPPSKPPTPSSPAAPPTHRPILVPRQRPRSALLLRGPTSTHSISQPAPPPATPATGTLSAKPPHRTLPIR